MVGLARPAVAGDGITNAAEWSLRVYMGRTWTIPERAVAVPSSDVQILNGVLIEPENESQGSHGQRRVREPKEGVYEFGRSGGRGLGPP